MSIAPKLTTDARLALQMSVRSALRLLNNHDREPFHAGYLLTIVRMIDWMTHSNGYPVRGRNDLMCAVSNVNKICLELMHDGRFDFIKMRENLLLLIEPSPFTVDTDDIDNIKLFLTELNERLENDINANPRSGFNKRML